MTSRNLSLFLAVSTKMGARHKYTTMGRKPILAFTAIAKRSEGRHKMNHILRVIERCMTTAPTKPINRGIPYV